MIGGAETVRCRRLRTLNVVVSLLLAAAGRLRDPREQCAGAPRDRVPARQPRQRVLGATLPETVFSLRIGPAVAPESVTLTPRLNAPLFRFVFACPY